jgi:hypothetical protein
MRVYQVVISEISQAWEACFEAILLTFQFTQILAIQPFLLIQEGRQPHVENDIFYSGT